MLPSRVLVSLIVSLLLHLVALVFIGRLREEEKETELLRARLAYQPRYIPPPRLSVPSLDLARVEMEYLAPESAPGQLPETELTLPPAPLPSEEMVLPLPEISVAEPSRSTVPQLAREIMPGPTGLVAVDAAESEAMELLRIEDLARADEKRAVVFLDPYSRRDLRGYVNFTFLRLDGVSNLGKPLDALARYMRDHTLILARVRPKTHIYFRSAELLKDPIHFMFPGPRLGGKSSQRNTHLSEEELELLGRYLRGGGFLFIEGEPPISGSPDGEPADSSGWMREMIVHVHDALYPDGRLIQVPFSHPVYHSFYDFDAGFPGEKRRGPLDAPVPASYFRRGEIDTPGLWGVELDGELVAVFSNTRLHISEDDAPPDISALVAATNIVVYALTRPGGLTTRRMPPAWKPGRPEIPLSNTLTMDVLEEVEDSDLFAALGASLALIHLPLGNLSAEGRLRLKVDEGYSLELSARGIHGLLLHNLPAGPHRIELEYGGKHHQAEVELQGGRVLTATFTLNRIAFYRYLRLKLQDEQIEVKDWVERFSDLQIEERYFDAREDWEEDH